MCLVINTVICTYRSTGASIQFSLAYIYAMYARYNTTDLRHIDENKFNGTVEAFGSLTKLEKLYVSSPCVCPSQLYV